MLGHGISRNDTKRDVTLCNFRSYHKYLNIIYIYIYLYLYFIFIYLYIYIYIYIYIYLYFSLSLYVYDVFLFFSFFFFLLRDPVLRLIKLTVSSVVLMLKGAYVTTMRLLLIGVTRSVYPVVSCGVWILFFFFFFLFSFSLLTCSFDASSWRPDTSLHGPTSTYVYILAF